MVNNGFDSFNTPLTPLRFQSSLGKESERRYKEGKNIVRLTLAKVAKINYKYNTVDVVTTIYKNTTSKNPEDNGRFSARLPVSFGGRTPDGKVYGANTLVTVGSLVLIGFLEGSKDYPIVLNIYGDLDNQSQLTRTTFTSADESDEAIQRELWQLFNLYPSMTYQSIDGHGNQEITFSGKTFMYVTDSDPENEYVQDAGFDYDHLPSSRYANGELIEPKSSKSPTLLYVHQGVYDDHRVTFFIKSDGTVRYGSRHLDGGGITYHEMKTDGSFNLTQKIGTTNPEEEGTKQSSIGIDEDGNIILETYKGAYLNGRSLGALGGDIDLGNLEEGILDARASIDILKDQIKFTASRTELDNLTEKIMEQEASFIVAYNEISSRVTRNEYHNLARPSANLLHNTTFTNTLLPYGEGTQLTVAEKDVNELTVRRAGASSEFGVYIGHAKPMKLAKGKEYTLSFEGDFEPISSINKLSIVTKEGVKQELPELEVQALGEEDEYPRYQVTFTSEETYEDNAYLLLAVESTESDSFTIRKVQIEEGDEATPWYPSYKDFDIVDRYDTEIAQLADSISLTANSVKSIGESVDGLSGDMGKALARINEAELKITPEAITSTVRESDAYLADLLAAREYAEEMAGLVAIEVGEVYESLGDLNEFINGAFHDGIISEAEAQAISKYINILETEKADVTAKYDQIYNTPELEGTIKSTLSTAKNNYNTAHSQLIATINSAIEDMHTTPEESLAVDQAFGDYRRRLAALSDVLEMAIDSIAQAKANAAEQKAKEHADGLYSTTSSQIEQLSSEINMRVTEETYNAGLKDAKDYAADLFIPISLDLTELSDVLSDLDTYIDGAFRDGVIEESEAKAIQKYLNILKSEKVDVDVRYNEIYTNSDLPEDIRSEIQAAKGAFDTSHTNLITSINNAIRDGKTTIDEALDVDVKFNAYSNTLANLTGWFETATNTIGTVKSEKAYQKSKEYADGEMGVLSEQIRQAELKITPEAITSTVRKSTEYMDDLKDKVGVEEIISRINQSAEEILIEARRIRISGDTTVENGALRWEYSSGGTLVLGERKTRTGY